MIDIRLIPQPEFSRVRGDGTPGPERLALLADMCRFNTLSAVKRAGSGHLGSSFSAMDIVVWLYFREMNTLARGHRRTPTATCTSPPRAMTCPGFTPCSTRAAS